MEQSSTTERSTLHDQLCCHFMLLHNLWCVGTFVCHELEFFSRSKCKATNSVPKPFFNFVSPTFWNNISRKCNQILLQMQGSFSTFPDQNAACFLRSFTHFDFLPFVSDCISRWFDILAKTLDVARIRGWSLFFWTDQFRKFRKFRKSKWLLLCVCFCFENAQFRIPSNAIVMGLWYPPPSSPTYSLQLPVFSTGFTAV